MTFAGYIDTIKAKTGLGPKDFVELARKKGLLGSGLRANEVVAWLAKDYGLGRGHAMALVVVFKAAADGKRTDDERIDALFSGGKAKWRDAVESLLGKVEKFGDDVDTSPTDTYLSLTRDGRKFAILQPAAAHLDMGIKRKGTAATERFSEAGAWNSMVTHRVRVTEAKEIDREMMTWLKAAYTDA